jgi:hypothetical protein
MGGGPWFCPLPPQHDDFECEFLLAWKQDNNGQTFIASPYPLPWLDGGLFGTAIRSDRTVGRNLPAG